MHMHMHISEFNNFNTTIYNIAIIICKNICAYLKVISLYNNILLLLCACIAGPTYIIYTTQLYYHYNIYIKLLPLILLYYVLA